MAVVQALPAIPFEIDVDTSRAVRGALTRPDLAPPHPTVVILPDVPGTIVDSSAFREAALTRLVAGGVAGAAYMTYHEDDAPRSATGLVDDAERVIGHLAERDDVDEARLGVLACGASAVVASALVARGAPIARLALLGATTGDAMKQRAGKANGIRPVIEADEAYLEEIAGLSSPADLAADPRPTLVLHGAADRIVPASDARSYLTALEVTDHPAEHELIARGDHALEGDVVREVALARLLEFFGRRSDA